MQQEQEAVEMGGEQGEGEKEQRPSVRTGGDLPYSGLCTPKWNIKFIQKLFSHCLDSRGMSAPSSADIASSRRLLPHQFKVL